MQKICFQVLSHYVYKSKHWIMFAKYLHQEQRTVSREAKNEWTRCQHQAFKKEGPDRNYWNSIQNESFFLC